MVRTRGLGHLAAAAVLAVAAVAFLATATVVPGSVSLGTLEEQLDMTGFADTGTCDLRARNASNPLVEVQRTFPCRFAWTFVSHGDGTTRIHEKLVNLDADRVVRIPGLERGNLEEWFTVRNRLFADDAYRYDFDPGAGVFTPPPRARDEVDVGFVTSGGRADGSPRLQLIRSFREMGTETVEGVDVVHWNASYRRRPIRWHGYDQLRTEHVDAWIHRPTGLALRNEVHVLVEMTPAQMARVHGIPAPDGGEPIRTLELTYRTSPASTRDHAAKVQDLRWSLWPVENGLWAGAASGAGALGLAWLGWRARRRPGRRSD